MRLKTGQRSGVSARRRQQVRYRILRADNDQPVLTFGPRGDFRASGMREAPDAPRLLRWPKDD